MFGDFDWGYLEVFVIIVQRSECMDVLDLFVVEVVVGFIVEEFLSACYVNGVVVVCIYSAVDLLVWEYLVEWVYF